MHDDVAKEKAKGKAKRNLIKKEKKVIYYYTFVKLIFVYFSV